MLGYFLICNTWESRCDNVTTMIEPNDRNNGSCPGSVVETSNYH